MKRKRFFLFCAAVFLTIVYIFYATVFQIAVQNSSTSLYLLKHGTLNTLDFESNPASEDTDNFVGRLSEEIDVEEDYENIDNTEPNKDFYIYPNERDEAACKIPHLNPFDSSILKYVKKVKKLNCSKKYRRPILFRTDLNSHLITLKDPEVYGLYKCCYKQFERKNEMNARYFKTCYLITSDVISIPEEHEFITVYCNTKKNGNGNFKTIDMFHFVHNKNSANIGNMDVHAPDSQTNSSQSNDLLSIALIGIDSVSHMNFIRTMTESYRYLKNDLSAIGLNGYIKIGDNTFPNLVPILTGLKESELRYICWGKNGETHFDWCPFIWKEFKATGKYYTSFFEDASAISIFNFAKSGFETQPTDFYLRTFARAFENKLGHKSSANHGNSNLCYGNRRAFSFGLEHIQKLSVRTALNEENGNTSYPRRFFALTWSSSLTHDLLNLPRHGDHLLLSFLKWFKGGTREEGPLNRNTLLIVLSDHGMRWGDIRATVQGQIEERMPFLYFVFPDWFKDKYSEAIANMKLNSERLTSPLDLFETLKDLLNPEANLGKSHIRTRSNELLRKVRRDELPRGMSLFLPVPLSRTCADAQIEPHFCVCQSLVSITNLNSSTLVKNGTAFVLKHLNGRLSNYKKCAKLKLKSVISAQEGFADDSHYEESTDSVTTTSTTAFPYATTKSTKLTNVNENDSTNKKLILTFQTNPSNAIFEASIIAERNGAFKMGGEVTRLNLYGNQSACISDAILKKYCYCQEKGPALTTTTEHR